MALLILAQMRMSILRARSSWQGPSRRLTEGMSVAVDVIEGPDGYEATRVVPMQAGEGSAS